MSKEELLVRLVDGDAAGVEKALEKVDEDSGEVWEIALRCAARLALEKFDEAFEDACVCVEREPRRAIHVLRKGESAFRMGEYTAAKDAFGMVVSIAKELESEAYLEQAGATWQERVDAVLEDLKGVEGGEVEKKVGEVEEEDSKKPSMEERAKAAIPSELPSAPPSLESKAVAKVGTGVVPSQPPRGYVSSQRVEHFQSGSSLSLTFYAKGCVGDGSSIRVERRSDGGQRLVASLKQESGDLWETAIMLWGEVSEEGELVDRAKFRKMTVEVILTASDGQKWPVLAATKPTAATRAEEIAAAEREAAEKAKAIEQALQKDAEKTGPRNVSVTGKDWDALDKELEEEEENDTGEGEEALQKLFSKIYSKSSDETRRAMVKSFTESAGTVLSTNWEEVGSKDLSKDIKPPEGMELRKKP